MYTTVRNVLWADQALPAKANLDFKIAFCRNLSNQTGLSDAIQTVHV